MKKRHIIYMGMYILIGTSCSNQDVLDSPAINNSVQVTAGIVNSRVVFNQGNNAVSANWQNGDSITLYTPTQNNLVYQAEVSEDAITANFSPNGKSLLDIANETVYACYPAQDIDENRTTLPSTDKWTDVHPLPFAYAVSSIQESKVNLEFKQIFSFLQLKLAPSSLTSAATTDGDKTIHRLLVESSSGSLGIISGTFDFETQKTTISEASKSVELTLTDAFHPDSVQERLVYVPVLPQASDVTVDIYALHDYDGGCDTLLVQNKQTPSGGFSAGHVYALTFSGNSSAIIEGESAEIHLAEAGTLSTYITDENKYTIKSLKLSGNLNGSDIKLLREMAGRDYDGNETVGVLTDIDLGEATIVEGGDSYRNYERKTKNDVWGYMFFDYTNIKNIVLPNNIVSIEKYAFSNCNALEKIIIPNSVETIDDRAFEYCNILKEISLGENIVSIGWSAFYNCDKLTEVTIPSSVKFIGGLAFGDCSILSTVTIEEGVETIGYNAFRGIALEKLILPNSLKLLGENSFEYCCSLTNVSFGKNIEKIGEQAFIGCELLSEVSIPEDAVLDSIGNSAFAFCDILNNITLPKAVTYIGESAFSGCTSLPSVAIPDNVKTIGESAFKDCAALSTVEMGSGVTTIGSHAFQNCQALSEISIPEGVTEINTCVFDGCTALKSVSISDNITSIGEYAFRDCGSLGKFVVPDAVTTIASDAFNGCSTMSELTLGNNITTIGDGAFASCSSLKKVDLPESLTSLGQGAFAGCSSLISATNAILDNYGIFRKCSSLKDITISKKTKKIGQEAFWVCESLEKVELPDDIISIGRQAFRSCESLDSIYLPSSIVTIEQEAFMTCSSLKEITLPEKLTKINANTFEACDSLTAIVIPDAVTAIDKNAFIGCKSLGNLKIGKSVTVIQTKAFYDSPITECYSYTAIPATINTAFSTSHIDTTAAKLYVPKGSLAAYQESDWATYFGNIIEMEE